MTPFTRADLIRCVQRGDPNCSPNSINPIIQGLTDNLRGGAPGAVGKNLLHSVGRGQFVLNDPASRAVMKAPSNTSIPHMTRTSGEQNGRPFEVAHGALKIHGYAFKYICDIEPERNDNGAVRTFSPHYRYKDADLLALNKYGTGPFCKFKVLRGIAKSGVYAFVVDERVQYIGECENLSNRFNMGYGNISPRNCFTGGQETNCRINSLVFASVAEGLEITLWFHETDNYKEVERVLRKQEKLAWNRI